MERKLLVLWSLITFGLILAYASWWAWYGGWFWGPRFFLFASFPSAWFLAKWIHSDHQSFSKTLISLIVITLSLWVGVNGLVFRQKTLDLCIQNNYALEFLCWYVPEFSPLIRPFIAQAGLSTFNILTLIIFGGLWLYISLPMILDLVDQIKVILRTYLSFFRFSSWRF
jgi:hypothetical protein